MKKCLFWFTFGFILILGASWLFGADGTTTKTFDWNSIWKGIVGGLLASIVGFLKDKEFSFGSFSWWRFVERIAWGLVVGIVAGLKRVDLIAGENFLLSIPMITVLWTEIWKLIWRRVGQPGLASLLKSIVKISENPSTPPQSTPSTPSGEK